MDEGKKYQGTVQSGVGTPYSYGYDEPVKDEAPPKGRPPATIAPNVPEQTSAKEKPKPKAEPVKAKSKSGEVTYVCPTCTDPPVVVTNEIDDVTNIPLVLCDTCKSPMVPEFRQGAA